MTEFFFDSKFIGTVDHLKELEKLIDIKTEQLQHLLGTDEDNVISVLKNEYSRLTSDCIRLMKQKASLNKEINDLQRIELKNYGEISLSDKKEENMSIKDPRDIVKDILDKNSGAGQREIKDVLSDENKAKFRKEALDLAYQASFQTGLFNMKWPVISNSLPSNPTTDETLQYQLDILAFV